MSLFLSIDPGMSHTGLAVSDSTQLVRPLATIHSQNLKKTINQINLLINKHRPTHIIIGQPLHGPIHSLAQDLFDFLKKNFNGQTYLFSEDLSSKIAVKKLVQSNNPVRSRRRKQHAASAAVILQTFLDSQI